MDGGRDEEDDEPSGQAADPPGQGTSEIFFRHRECSASHV